MRFVSREFHLSQIFHILKEENKRFYVILNFYQTQERVIKHSTIWMIYQQNRNQLINIFLITYNGYNNMRLVYSP